MLTIKCKHYDHKVVGVKSCLKVSEAGSVGKYKIFVRQVAICQWLAHWPHNPVVWVQILAGDLPTKSEMKTLSRHFCASLYVGHARRSRPVLDYRITDS